MYWIPLVIFSFVGYGFSIFNRTISNDDLVKDYIHTIIPYSGRWGMLVWEKLVGVTDLVPFVDRFVTLLLLFTSSVLLGSLFYYLKNRSGNVLTYTVLSSIVLTYPLINEIYDYTSADIQYTGNLALILLTFIYLSLKRNTPPRKRKLVISIATIMLVLPASSYEVGLFSYVTLLCVVILYKYINSSDHDLTFKQWVRENCFFLIPMLLAVVIRFVVHFTILFINNASYVQLGGSEIDYSNITFIYIVGSNIFRYYVAGLVYFPITVFVIFSFIYFVIIIRKSVLERNYKIFLLAMITYLSIFLVVIVRGLCMDYKIAQSLTIFIAFVAFLLCEIKIPRFSLLIPSFLLFLCWHQSVYLNNVLSLNNMRSNNEISSFHYIGDHIVSRYGNKKPVVFIRNHIYGGYLGPWIDKRLYADTNTWNGRIFEELVNDYLPEKYRHYKYVINNTNNQINWLSDSGLRDFFSYCGYDINIVPFATLLSLERNDSVMKRYLMEQYEDARTTMNQLEIKDIGMCLFVKY